MGEYRRNGGHMFGVYTPQSRERSSVVSQFIPVFVFLFLSGFFVL